MNCYYGRHQNYSGQYLTMETLLKTITHVIKQCQGITNLKKIKSSYPSIKLLPFENIKCRFLELDNQNKTIQLDHSQTPIWFIDNFQNNFKFVLQKIIRPAYI